MTSTSPALTPRFRRAISRPVTLITPGLFRSLEATPAWDNAPAHAAMSVAIPIGRNNILPTPSSCGTEPTLYRRLAPAFLACDQPVGSDRFAASTTSSPSDLI